VARAFATERSNRSRMCEEKGGLLPYMREQIVEIVWRRRSRARTDSHRGNCRMEQAVFGIVQDLRLLAFLDTVDRQAKLFAQLIVHVVVEIGDASVKSNYSLDSA
jgi:hypothetical protein